MLEKVTIIRKIVLPIAFILIFFSALIFLSMFLMDQRAIRISEEDQMRSLPYVTWTEAKSKDTGVTIYKKEKTCNGINIIQSDNKPEAQLMGMDGSILHTLYDKRKKATEWLHITPYGKDHFLVMVNSEELFMIDWESNVKWSRRMHFHHEITITEEGDIYSLTQKLRHVPELGFDYKVRDNYLVLFLKDGSVKETVSFSDILFRDAHYIELAVRNRKKDDKRHKNDIFHINTVEILDRDIYDGEKLLYKKGDILICIRNMDIIAILDIEKKEVLWSWGDGELDRPHMPTLLDNGNIMIFDNGFYRNYSRVIEVDPITGIIEWEYKGSPPEAFHSITRGSAQRLPNGNTLIAESWYGRIFEIDRKKEIVWEYHNPEFDKKENKRASIYRAQRITDRDLYPELWEILGGHVK